VFVSPTEPNSDILDRSIETNNEITRAGLSGRGNRDFGPKWAEGGDGNPSVGVARATRRGTAKMNPGGGGGRDTGGETEQRHADS
jgi:hypothetical protein